MIFTKNKFNNFGHISLKYSVKRLLYIFLGPNSEKSGNSFASFLEINLFINLLSYAILIQKIHIFHKSFIITLIQYFLLKKLASLLKVQLISNLLHII